MGRYCSVASLKNWRGIEQPVDNDKLSEAIDAAEEFFDRKTHRIFFAVHEWRVYHATRDVDGNTLYLDYDLVKDTEIRNGDDSIIPVARRFLVPANRPPYWAIELDHTVYWTWSGTPINAIRVRGWWGYSMKAPEDVVQSIRLAAAKLYKEKDSQIFGRVGFAEGGQLILEEALPSFVYETINHYQRLGVA